MGVEVVSCQFVLWRMVGCVVYSTCSIGLCGFPVDAKFKVMCVSMYCEIQISDGVMFLPSGLKFEMWMFSHTY
jgi:hypothetical protein